MALRYKAKQRRPEEKLPPAGTRLARNRSREEMATQAIWQPHVDLTGQGPETAAYQEGCCRGIAKRETKAGHSVLSSPHLLNMFDRSEILTCAGDFCSQYPMIHWGRLGMKMMLVSITSRDDRNASLIHAMSRSRASFRDRGRGAAEG